MNFRMTGIVLLSMASLAASALAQNAPAPATATRTVVAATKLASVVDTPIYFKVLSVTLPAGEKSSVSGANGVLYQISGTTEISLDGAAKTVNAGEGLFIPAGKTAEVKAGGTPSTFFHYFLVPAADVDKPAEAAPATVKELYRTAAPIPDLKAGAYDLNLTRVTFPAGMPSNAPHHRSGAALYYVISGSGVNTIDGNAITRTPGTFIYEPYRLVHQWGNPDTEPLTFVTLNINPEGVAAVLPGTPAD